jgi:heptosyltransferase III
LNPSEASSLLPGLPEGAEILILRLRSLGDMVLETPAIAALHAWRPDLKICVLAEPWCAAVLEGNHAVSEVVLSRGTLETGRRLRRKRFPIVFNQHGGPRSASLTAFSRARARVCWAGYQFSFLYNVHVPDREEFFGRGADVHMVEHRMSQFWFAGLPRGPIPRTRVFPQRDAIESVERALAEKGIAGGKPYAVVQPGARLASMRWPAKRFGELARWLRDAHGIVSVVNLGRRDDEVAGEVRGAMGDCAVVMDSLNARELIALIAGARVFVGNDSGPAHVAAAVDCGCVVIFGATKAAEWRPWRWERSRVIQSERMNAIGVDEAKRACEEVIAAG